MLVHEHTMFTGIFSWNACKFLLQAYHGNWKQVIGYCALMYLYIFIYIHFLIVKLWNLRNHIEKYPNFLIKHFFFCVFLYKNYFRKLMENAEWKFKITSPNTDKITHFKMEKHFECWWHFILLLLMRDPLSFLLRKRGCKSVLFPAINLSLLVFTHTILRKKKKKAWMEDN